MIVGIDEVGRGPWAGPVVVGAVVLGEASIEGLTDSKKLTKKRREMLALQVHEQALAVGIGWVTSEELDEIGMSKAMTLGCRRALEQVHVPYTQIILDGTVNFLKDTGKGPYVTTLAKADLLVPSVSAASIIAKVARDAYMAEQDIVYPGYGFSSHAGYGTAAHRIALESHGVTPLHRKSFAPIAALLGNPVATEPTVIKQTTSKQIGDTAESAAAAFLHAQGYTVIARNWRTKACEIDIVARKKSVIHFVEVKYRRTNTQGGGLAAITPTKLKQMQRAARIWQQRHGEADAALSVVEVTGENYAITEFLVQV